MVAEGLWGAQLGAPAIWLLPVTFPLVMAFGGFLALIGVPLPGVELGIATSAILLGAMVALQARPPLALAALLVAFFAVFHGHAHGTELPAGQSGLLYSVGFVVATGALHAVGISIGLIHRWARRTRPAARSRRCGVARGCLLPLAGDRMSPIERRPRIALFIAALLAPAIARAHLTDTGLGPVYDGIAHLLMSFEDLLPVVALALVAGLNGAREGRLALFTLPVAWLLGGAAGASLGAFAPPSWAPALSLLGLGVLTAASVRLAPPLVVALSAALGLVHGSLNGAGIADAGRDATERLASSRRCSWCSRS